MTSKTSKIRDITITVVVLISENKSTLIPHIEKLVYHQDAETRNIAKEVLEEIQKTQK